MTAKVVPIFDDPGFFGGCKISVDEAPREVVEKEEPAYDYYAVVWKYSGQVEAEDFLRLARRLTVLCFQVYGRAVVELRAAPRVLSNFHAPIGARSDLPHPDPRFDVSRLSYDAFRAIFASSFSVGLRIAQKTTCWGEGVAHALIEWSGHKPDLLLLSAHRGSAHDPRTGGGQLEKLLLRKLFHVRGMPPDHRFDVNLGFEAYNEATFE